MPTRLEQLVIDAARARPHAIAITDARESWTYRELDAWSDRLAARFSRLGLIAGDRVALWAPKSCRAVAALQAALRIGAIYVPIDPATPAMRAATILRDCDVRLVVTTRAMQGALSGDRERREEGTRATLVCCLLDDEPPSEPLSEVIGAPLSTTVANTDGDALAYILYTSGSTGTPKGVCLTHRNALAFVEWAVAACGLADRDGDSDLDEPGGATFSSHAPFNFDLSVFDLYAAFLTRGTVCLIPETIAYTPGPLVRFLRDRRIDVWYSVPSVLMLMMDHGALLEEEPRASETDASETHAPRVVVFAGEPFPVRHLRQLRAHWPRARFFNFYGPTETNVCTAYEVRDLPADQVSPVPIGAAACGDRVWAMTDEGRIAAPGERGELFVEGPTVMRGYWGAAPQVGPYATGDICLRRADGHYEFIGRRDHMLKCRGHRVEPGEIEATLSQHPNVREVAVAAAGEGVEQRLVAFIAARERTPTLLELKAFSARSLPRYMLVDQVHALDALPRTPNGKVDRRALLQQLADAGAPAAGGGR